MRTKLYNFILVGIVLLASMATCFGQVPNTKQKSANNLLLPVHIKMHILLSNKSKTIQSNISRKTTAIGNPVDFNSALIAGANYLKNAQSSTDGGWDWILKAPNFTHSGSPSADNLYGVTALGLYYAFLRTNDASYKTAMTNAANAMIANNNVKDASAIKFLLLYNALPGISGTTYQDAAKSIYDAQVAAHGGTATSLAEYIRDQRGIVQGYHDGIIGWDLGAWAVAAQMLYQKFGGTYNNDAASIAEVAYYASFVSNTDYFDLTRCAGWDPTYSNEDYWWYNLGISGLIDAFNASGAHTNEIPGLITKLENSQAPSGGFCSSYGVHTDDEDWQTTAYVIMSLSNLDPTSYKNEINHGVYYLASTQDASGGWVYNDNTNYPEIAGECTNAIYFGQNANTVWVDASFTSSSCAGHFWGYDAFSNITDGINGVISGGTVNVAAGIYKEQLNITKGLTLTGDVSHPDNVIIDGENKTNLTNDGQVRIYNPTGSVIFEGFKIINTGTHGGEYFAVLTKGDVARTIQDCKIIGHGASVGLGDDYGMWANGGSGELTIKDNYFNNTYHGILLERQSGASTISGNTFDNLFTGTLNGVKYGGRAIEAINYGTSDITSLQKISNNQFINFKSTGVQISGGFSGQTSKKFTNVLIENNDFDFSTTDITNLNGAIYLTNPLNNDVNGGVTAVIKDNTFHVPSGNGLQVYGLNGTITCNNNSFEGNGKYGVKADQSLGTAIDATLNWWNNASGPYNAATNPLGTGDSVTNNVVYSPWLGNKTDAPHDANHPWTWYINSGSIDNVVNTALAGDTIIVLPGTYDAFTIEKPLVLNGSGNVFINHGSPAITVSSTGVTIIGFTFNFDAAFYAIRINNGAYNVTIHNCKFMNLNGSGATGYGVVNQGSGIVDATYNYWNSSTGPTIASNANGTGSIASVTGSGKLYYFPWYKDAGLTTLSAPALVSPSNGLTGVSVVPTLSWTSIGAASYKLYVSTVSDFSSSVYTSAGPGYEGTNTSKIFDPTIANFPLANATKYYWKIGAFDQDGNEYTSDTYHFTTIIAAMPTLLLPANGVELGGASTIFSWYTLVSGIQFELQISTSSDFNSFVIDTTTANTFVSVDNTNFALGTTYYWKVISKTIPVSGNPVIINYSGTRKFSMEGLPKPIAYYPVNNASVISNPPTMNWYVLSINPKVTEYHVKYSTTPNDGSLTFPTTCTDTKGEFSTGTTDSYSVIPHALKPGTKYYWSVASSDGTHESAYSDETSFTVFGNVQFAVCYPSYPTGGAQLFTNQPTLYWFTNMFAPGLQYQVRYSTDQSTWTKTKANKIFTTSYTFPDELTANSHYYWQVRASFDGSNWGPWSASGDFLTPAASSNASVPVPLPMFPSWGNVVSTVSPTLSWLAFSFSPLEYQVIWSTDPTLTGGVLSVAVDSSAWTSSDSYALSGLTQGSPYYWQVRSRSASDNSLVSAWSTLAWFMTSPGASTAVVPIAGNPIGGSPIQSNSTTLSWVIAAPSSSALTYDVQYSKNKDFSDAVTITSLKENNVTINNLANETTYYWRALSKTDSGNASTYSAPATFKTTNVTAVEKENVVPKEFSISQNYPNPFNPTTAIVYAIPKNTFVSIKIYNMLGQEVKTLVNSQMQAGTYTIQWNGDNEAGQHVTSGAYIYRIVAGNNIAVRKMLLIK